MAFELRGNTTSEGITEADTLLFDVARILLLQVPLVERLDRDFYESPSWTTAEAVALAEEFTVLAHSLAAQPEAAHRAWSERPPAFRSLIMSHPPDANAMVAQIEALARTCRDAVDHGAILRGLSD